MACAIVARAHGPAVARGNIVRPWIRYFAQMDFEGPAPQASTGHSAFGGHAQAGLFLWPRYLEIAGRGGYLDPDTTRAQIWF